MSMINHWRVVFRGLDVFEVIDKAIEMAAKDHPDEFRSRKESLRKGLFVEPKGVERKKKGRDSLLTGAEEMKSHDSLLTGAEDMEATAIVGDLAECSKNIKEQGKKTLTEVVEEEIWEIKRILYSNDDKIDEMLLASMRRLQRLEMTVDVLKATGIGRVVNGIPTQNKSDELRRIISKIIGSWKTLVDEWLETPGKRKFEGQDRDAAKKQRVKQCS